MKFFKSIIITILSFSSFKSFCMENSKDFLLLKEEGYPKNDNSDFCWEENHYLESILKLMDKVKRESSIRSLAIEIQIHCEAAIFKMISSIINCENCINRYEEILKNSNDCNEIKNIYFYLLDSKKQLQELNEKLTFYQNLQIKYDRDNEQ